MSARILTLNIGFVLAVAGASIATQILLYKSSETSSIVSHNSSGGGTGDGALRGETNGVNVPRVQIEDEFRGARGADRDVLSQFSSLSSEVSHPSVTRIENFDKRCFVVPAKSMESDNIELLTCYKDERIDKTVEVDGEEYDSLFHIHDSSKSDNPVKIDSNLEWNPTNQQLTALLTKKSNYEAKYIFTVAGNKWNGISRDLRDLLAPRECAIYKVGSEVVNSQYILTCGDDLGSYETKGIPLTEWQRKSK